MNALVSSLFRGSPSNNIPLHFTSIHTNPWESFGPLWVAPVSHFYALSPKNIIAALLLAFLVGVPTENNGNFLLLRIEACNDECPFLPYFPWPSSLLQVVRQLVHPGWWFRRLLLSWTLSSSYAPNVPLQDDIWMPLWVMSLTLKAISQFALAAWNS